MKIERLLREGPLIAALVGLLKILIVVTILEKEQAFRANFYLALSNAWTYVWEEWANQDDWFAFVILTNLYGTAVYWFVGLGFSILDFAGFEFLMKYKSQEGSNVPLKKSKFLKTMLQVLFNQFIVGPLFAIALMPILKWRGISCKAEDIPGLTTFLRHLVGFAVCEEVGFYYAHRMFHEIKPLYIRIHKQHHEWVAPIAIAARYAHPVEDVLANVGPVMLGPLVCGSHLVFLWIWMTLAMTSTLISHSGYHLPFLPSNEAHDFHHLRFDVNYGAFGVLDAIHNTDEKFRNSVQGIRHQALSSLRSARELIPDNLDMTLLEAKKLE